MQTQETTTDNYFQRVSSSKLPFVGSSIIIGKNELQTLIDILSRPIKDINSEDIDIPAFLSNIETLIEKAFNLEEPEALFEIHLIMYTIYEVYFMNPICTPVKHLSQSWLHQLKTKVEEKWMAYEIKKINHLLPENDVLHNFESLREWLIEVSNNKDVVNTTVTDYFKNEATIEDFKKFVHIDQHLNHRFYDAIALALPHFSEVVKTELSHHFWEEAGEGEFEGAHTYQFTKILDYFDIDINNTPAWNDWKPYAGYNIYLLFALNRQHYFKSIGSLGMPELFDVKRDEEIVSGLRRLGLNVNENFNYYIAHVELDADHGPEWLDKIIANIIKQEPGAALDISIGALIRMRYMVLFNQYLIEEFKIQ